MEQRLILAEILIRRKAQDKKWGIAKDRNHPHYHWLPILTEEFGEVGKALVEWIFDNKSTNGILYELIDVAAVCIAWMEDAF